MESQRVEGYPRARAGIARSFQIPKPFRSMTVLENLQVPLEYAAHGRAGRRHAADEALEVLEVIGLRERAQEDSANLTQVDMRKLELARAMAARPRLLISDEAMAGLSSNEVDEVLGILRRLNDTGITVIMIEHIMHAVMRFSERVICLDAGQSRAASSRCWRSRAQSCPRPGCCWWTSPRWACRRCWYRTR